MTGTAPGPSGALILPVRNAAPFLEGTLRAADAWLSSRPAPWEILVVDDGSSDGSGAIAERWLRDRGGPGEARLLRLASNRGKGFAVRAGILNARAPIVVFADCDLAYPLENVERLVAALGSGADAAIACRVLPGSTYRVSPSFFSYLYTRHAAGRLFNAVCRAVTLPGILDTQAGLKGFRAGAVRPLLDRLVLDGFSFDVELLRALADRGARIVEVPVDFRYDSEPTTTAFLGDSLRMARDLVRVRARSALGRYRRAEAAADSPRLVIHADDYGLAPGVNRAIEAALGSGAVTSASLLLGTPHAREAILWAKAHPELDFGVHLNLTRGRPVLPPGDVRSLVGPSGSFPGLRGLLARLASGGLRAAEVRAEWEAQAEAVAGAGVAVSHLDSHQHVHLIPSALSSAASDLARKMGIPLRAMDGPVRGGGAGATVKGAVLALASRLTLGSPRKRPGSARGFGLAIAARPGVGTVRAALSRMRPGETYEMLVHLGTADSALAETGDRYSGSREAERDLLLSEDLRAVLGFSGVRLVKRS